jgi:hypothetical protein
VKSLVVNVNKANTPPASITPESAPTADAVRAGYEAQLTQTRAELDAARLSGLRLTVALSAGFPAAHVSEFAKLLQGSTETELTAHAIKLKALIDSASTVADTPAPPRPVDPSQAATGAIDPEPSPGMGRLRNAYRNA